jgi:hypothetical protein
MNMSNNNKYNILDLPDEILFIIFNKLNMTDVLYSLVDITQRFNQVIFDPFYIRNVNMTSMTMKSFYDRIYSIDYQILDRICKSILPRISHQINKLIVEQHSIERILHTINYPQLHSLTLMYFSDQVLFNYLRSKLFNRGVIICLYFSFVSQLKIIQFFENFSMNKSHVLRLMLKISRQNHLLKYFGLHSL